MQAKRILSQTEKDSLKESLTVIEGNENKTPLSKAEEKIILMQIRRMTSFDIDDFSPVTINRL